MENTYGNKMPFIEQIPSYNRTAVKPQEVDIPIVNKNPELKNPFIIPGIRNLKIESQLNANYSFDNFLEGDSNRLARSAGMAVANKPGGTFNPLLIFGGVGLGKTHLAHAIGVEIKDKYPDKTVLYISAEIFTQQYIDSVKKNTRNDFIHFYQLIDVLIIDDVQFYLVNLVHKMCFSIFLTIYTKMGNKLFLPQTKLRWICKILNNVYYLDSNGDFLPNYSNLITKPVFQF